LQITKKTINHVANLARLNLKEEEVNTLLSQMGDILTYMDKLNSLDTSNVKPMEHVKPISNVFRDDIVAPSFNRDDILDNAPEKEDGAFSVPKIMD